MVKYDVYTYPLKMNNICILKSLDSTHYKKNCLIKIEKRKKKDEVGMSKTLLKYNHETFKKSYALSSLLNIFF